MTLSLTPLGQRSGLVIDGDAVGDIRSSPKITAVKGNVNTIQMMRAIASLLVVLCHALGASLTFSNAPELRTIEIWSHAGFAGVDLFFVISGFIMFKISVRTLESFQFSRPLTHATHFLMRRVVRIYPLYWITLCAAVIVPATSHSWGRLISDRLSQLLSDPLCLLLWGHSNVHGVTWTLVYEMFFYTIIAGLLLFGRARFITALILWCCFQTLCVAAALLGALPPYIIFSPFTLEFIIGVVLAFIISRGTKKFALENLVIGLLCLIAFIIFTDEDARSPILRVVGYAAPFASILYGFICLETTSRIRIPRSIVFCGDMSYSLYLWHAPLLFIVGFVWEKLGLFDRVEGVYGYFLASATSIFVVSAISYHCAEKPFMSWRISPRRVESLLITLRLYFTASIARLPLSLVSSNFIENAMHARLALIQRALSSTGGLRRTPNLQSLPTSAAQQVQVVTDAFQRRVFVRAAAGGIEAQC
jgi:exopolysaccharide production protein ExoZ